MNKRTQKAPKASFLLPVKHWLASQFRAIKRLDKEDLELQYAGQWPTALKILLLLAIFIAVVYASNWLLLDSARDRLNTASQQQERLFEDYRLKSFQAANLSAYRQQMVVMEGNFEALLAKLPAQSEVPRLLEDIHELAELYRLDLQSMTLRNEQQREFYTELPFEIQVRGDYHRIANFLAGISALDRIITLHNFRLSPTSGQGSNTQLNLVIEARTYRYDGQAQPATRTETTSRRQR